MADFSQPLPGTAGALDNNGSVKETLKSVLTREFWRNAAESLSSEKALPASQLPRSSRHIPSSTHSPTVAPTVALTRTRSSHSPRCQGAAVSHTCKVGAQPARVLQAGTG
ncbi:hypothetical protein EMIHUDRAFT_442376 [Emiliania huxleyi CCMP1516]|uniref:Uncharacterized protein n=2 Tax=Emiliania huxleyi TaxID=2903 RepID=A0A0D3K4Z6_EMIH1|nr:hypothetical protein EMIHUDRAFT_442376 [Emiliania huxleyi CCMP1516]EOD30831.1 hypothetical protein EMIHUDRAFT_442376 [Emiliania huxleyi CCMP1516]|eukprot:XP_005783260.1 hypothetical protein EMIHUDRAFT_442376 [Emiliania huxleyi CCMP1516]